MKIVAPLVLAAVLVSGCTDMFLQPTHERYPQLEMHGLVVHEFEIPSTDSVRLAAWSFPVVENQLARPDAVLRKATHAQTLVLQVHGNALNMSLQFQYLAWLPLAGQELITFDYRGFGGSEGRESVAGALEDTKAALRYVDDQAEKRGIKWVLVGQSIGGTLALRALEEQPVRHLGLIVIESAFRSYAGVAREKLAGRWWTWPFQWLGPLTVSNASGPTSQGLQTLAPGVPVILIRSKEDPVVPVHQTDLIWDELREPKEYWIHDENGHVNAFLTEDRRYRKQLLQKIQTLVGFPTR